MRFRLVTLSAVLIMTATAATPGTPRVPGDAATCWFNISASNTGTTSIYVMLYDSKVKITSAVVSSYRQLKIQNHRVAPGATMVRTYEARGACSKRRAWRFKLKKGSNFKTINRITVGGAAFSIGDLNKEF